MLTDEMIDTARTHGTELGKTAAEVLRKRPKAAPKVERLATGIVDQFSELMKQAGLVDDDIAVLCQTLRDAYQAELPLAGTRH
jgi:hypothetical protein